MRGLSLSYKESIDQVWQAAAVSGFFVVMRLNLILEEMIMEWNFLFFMNSVLLGVGLAMDAFSVSLANGMNEKNMKKSRRNWKLPAPKLLLSNFEFCEEGAARAVSSLSKFRRAEMFSER